MNNKRKIPSQEEVEAIFISKGDLLLDTYKNIRTKMKFICHCGKESSATLKVYRRAKDCYVCAQEKKKTPLKEIVLGFRNKNCYLLEETYINASEKVKYICACGRLSETIPTEFLKRNGLCWKCGCEKNRISNTKPFSEVKREIEETNKYTLLSLEQDYKNVADRFKIQCNFCGNIYSKNLYFFKHWCGCRHNPKSNCNIGEKHHMWIEDRELKNNLEKIADKARKCVRNAFNNFKEGEKSDLTFNILGYSKQDLYKHIVSLPNWDSLKDTNWHLDHVFPIKAFIDYGVYDLKIINCLENLNILSQFENISKHSKYNKREFEHWLSNKNIIFNHE